MQPQNSTELTRDLNRAAAFLREGRLVAFPTETVYGLGADARNVDAVLRIFEAKHRPEFDPLIVHVACLDAAREFVTEFPEPADALARQFWPGPLTLVLPKRDVIPDVVTAGLPGVGIRIPRHPLALLLLQSAGCPVAAPSANVFGAVSPTESAHVLDGLDGRIDLVLEGGACAIGLESTVVSFLEERPVLLRPGGCPVEDIENVIGPVARLSAQSGSDTVAQPAPGMLSRHYAPRTRLTVVAHDAVAVPEPGRRVGLLTEGTRPRASGFEAVVELSADGDLRVCAAAFFRALRELDALQLDAIVAHRFVDTGLGLALNDRLTRAAR